MSGEKYQRLMRITRLGEGVDCQLLGPSEVAVDAVKACPQELLLSPAAYGATPLVSRADALSSQLAVTLAQIATSSRLSIRETEVLQRVAAGRSNPEIADELFISPRTVTTHLTNIYAKLGVESRAEAVALALRTGLI